MGTVIILMASKADLEWSKKIAECVEEIGASAKFRIASAHKVPLQCLDILKNNENTDVVFITVAGRSNALSGFADAQTYCPVIACPPYSDKFAGNDVFSSLNMPSGVAPMTVLDPRNAALAAVKILAIRDDELRDKVIKFQKKYRDQLIKDDTDIKIG